MKKLYGISILAVILFSNSAFADAHYIRWSTGSTVSCAAYIANPAIGCDSSKISDFDQNRPFVQKSVCHYQNGAIQGTLMGGTSGVFTCHT